MKIKIKEIWNFCWEIYKKNEEIINYLITGAIGVAISISVYWICRKLHLDIVVSNVISWIIAVICMYILNKLFVFKTKCKNSISAFKEFIFFILARVFTLVVETLILWIGANILKINDIIVKIIAQIVIIILNYLLSKLWIFKKKVE